MSQKKENQEFTDLDYLFRKYYNENIAKVVADEYNHVQEMKKKERQQIVGASLTTNNLVTALSPGAYNLSLQQRYEKSEWNNKNSDDLIRGSRKRLTSDEGYNKDIQVFITAFKEKVVERITQQEYDKLCKQYGGDFATCYVSERFTLLTLEQLARQKMPKNSALYILEHGITGSFTGTAAMAFAQKGGHYDEEIDRLKEQLYEPSSTEEVAAGSLSLLIDMPLLWFGKAAKAAKWTFGSLRQAIQKQGTAIVRKEMQQLIKKEGRQAVADGIKKDIKENGIGAVRNACRERVIVAGKEAVRKSTQMLSPRKAITDFGLIAGTSYIFHQLGKDDDAGPVTVLEAAIGEKTGNPEAFKSVRKDSANKVKPEESDTILSVCSNLSKPVKLPYSQKKASAYYQYLTQGIQEPSQILSTVKANLDAKGIKVKDGEIPEKLKNMEFSELADKSFRFLSIVLEMKETGLDKLPFYGRSKVFDNYCQQAYDYARAANIKYEQALAQQKTQVEAYNRQASMAQQADLQALAAQMYGQQRQESHITPEEAYNSLSPWKSFMNLMGLDTFGDTGKHFGSVLACLPETIIGMLTGKEGAMKLSDNLISFACIIGGMMVKHPLLKMLLLCVGGLGILNRAAQHTLGKDATSRAVRPCYQHYDEEDLDPRIQCHKIHGHYLLADIDNCPYKILLDDNTLNAYERGALPMSVIGNEVLRRFDSQRQALSTAYNKNINDQIEEQERSARIRH